MVVIGIENGHSRVIGEILPRQLWEVFSGQMKSRKGRSGTLRPEGGDKKKAGLFPGRTCGATGVISLQGKMAPPTAKITKTLVRMEKRWLYFWLVGLRAASSHQLRALSLPNIKWIAC